MRASFSQAAAALACLLVLSGQAAAADAPVSSPRVASGPHRVSAQLAFSHWYDNTFDAPLGIYTPVVTIGVVPWPWLETRARYTLSLRKLSQPDRDAAYVGFATVQALVGRELRVQGERLRIGVGPTAGFVHVADELRAALGVALSARYLIDVNERLSLGPMFDVVSLAYRLPGDSRALYEREGGNFLAPHSDVQVDLGVILSGW